MNAIRKIIFLPLADIFRVLSVICINMAADEQDIKWLKEHADD